MPQRCQWYIRPRSARRIEHISGQGNPSIIHGLFGPCTWKVLLIAVTASQNFQPLEGTRGNLLTGRRKAAGLFHCRRQSGIHGIELWNKFSKAAWNQVLRTAPFCTQTWLFFAWQGSSTESSQKAGEFLTRGKREKATQVIGDHDSIHWHLCRETLRHPSSRPEYRRRQSMVVSS
jgi:hypothetical protein